MTTDVSATAPENRRAFIAAAFAAIGCQPLWGADDARLRLPITGIEPRIAPYEEFCRRQPRHCQLTGRATIPMNEDLMSTLRRVNTRTNRDIRFALDREIHGAEDYWTLPVSGYGDCEDIALEKRHRLTRLGYPTAALRLALVFHDRHMTSHCILTIETDAGTFLMDSQDDRVTRWDRSPYHFEARERVDGLWDRFDQSDWWSNGVEDPPSPDGE
ncbi:MAG: transglutaminase-like cysteine peptidase [Gammaproteobacteria bacterium]|nr:transglutaminase-like cysteine peptidase [Gammaproteobacteria bacterium]